ncbi:MAG TPA: glycosyltransferase [Devosiaceae bacterium]|jgi:glycosyltransferase involved in cell wall biosynthesis|nr:glycosyltransferase [Devosiaceae bacterium]
MKVWLVRDTEPVPGDAGKGRLLRAGMLCEALVGHGHQVRWFTSTFDHYAARHRPGGRQSRGVGSNLVVEILPGLGYRRSLSLRRILHNRSFARAFLGAAGELGERPDIILADLPTTESAAAAVALAREWGIPSIVSVRDRWPDFFVSYLPAWSRWLARPAIGVLDRQARRACRGASAIVGISEAYLEWGLGKAGRERGAEDAVIPLGYPAPASEPGDEEKAERYCRELGVSPTDRLVCFVGSWGRTYDLDTAVEAALLLRDRLGLRFVFAGDGESHARIARRVGGVDSIILPGWIDSDQVRWLLRRAEVGLMPYDAAAPQGLPNKIFEYMAYGVFQVSTLAGEAAEMLAACDAGITCPSGDAGAIARAIETAVERSRDPMLRRKIEELFMSRYDARIVYGNYVRVIESIAQKGRR